MAIISRERYASKEKLRLEISSEILAQIKDYCSWAEIDDISFFIEEAACFVFNKDQDWKQKQKSDKRAEKIK